MSFSGYYTYNDNYSEENYEYENVEEEEEYSFVPVLQSSPTVYRVKRGHTARLDCKVDKLGPMVLSWKKVSGNSSEYIVTGRTVMTDRSRRISVLTSSSSSILMLSKFGPEDVGQYQCEVSSTPPVYLTHSLRLRNKPRVKILGNSKITLKEGDELGLVCKVKVLYKGTKIFQNLQGDGEPQPVVSWKKEVTEEITKLIRYLCVLV